MSSFLAKLARERDQGDGVGEEVETGNEGKMTNARDPTLMGVYGSGPSFLPPRHGDPGMCLHYNMCSGTEDYAGLK